LGTKSDELRFRVELMIQVGIGEVVTNLGLKEQVVSRLEGEVSSSECASQASFQREKPGG